MAAATNFTPKQCTPPGPDVLDKIQGALTSDIARHSLTLPELPPITGCSIVHDNACGTGAVTAIIASNDIKPSKIYATDISPLMLNAVNAKVDKNGWKDRVKTSVIDIMDLKGISNDLFTHSITNFCIQSVSDPSKAAREIHRTIKPTGAAVITAWATESHVKPLFIANHTTRGSDASLRFPWKSERCSSLWLETLLGDAGFSSVYVSQREEYLKIENLLEWCELWWSFLGTPQGGWTPDDEKQWGEAVGAIMECIKRNQDVEVKDDGGAVCKFVANVAIARK